MPSLEVLPRSIGQQSWLDPIAHGVQAGLRQAFSAAETARPGLEAALRGDWLGHPLHPALTDLPVGAWSVAAALDVIDALGGPTELRATADASLGIGLIGATAVALTGLRDYKEVEGEARRVGAVHGLLNTMVAMLLTASWLSRSRGNRGAGQSFAWVGYALMLISAQLGGDLVYRLGAGITEPTEIEVSEPFLAQAG